MSDCSPFYERRIKIWPIKEIKKIAAGFSEKCGEVELNFRSRWRRNVIIAVGIVRVGTGKTG
jgi:hypothetical protein